MFSSSSDKTTASGRFPAASSNATNPCTPAYVGKSSKRPVSSWNRGHLTGVYKNLRLGVVALVFKAAAIGGQTTVTEETRQVGWWPLERVQQEMSETFAARVLDAIHGQHPAVRLHDGVHLIDETVTQRTPRL